MKGNLRHRLWFMALFCWIIRVRNSVFAWHACQFNGTTSKDQAEVAICPDGNTCCMMDATSNISSSSLKAWCISGKGDDYGTCCMDHEQDGNSVPTGCGDGFECSSTTATKTSTTSRTTSFSGERTSLLLPHLSKDDDDNSPSRIKAIKDCQKVNPNRADIPDRVPRYQLCSVTNDVLQRIYGFPINWAENITGDKNHTDSLSHRPLVAYLSTLGALDSRYTPTMRRQKEVETVIILIHGSGRNPDDYICCTNTAAQMYHAHLDSSVSDVTTTMIVAPWFLAPSDPLVTLFGHPPNVRPLQWFEWGPIEHTWRYGADSIEANVSSYAVTDAIVDYLVSKRQSRFPSLKQIVVAGHSAGGQYTQRWALLSNSIAFDSSQLSDNTIKLRVVVANPKSFCFLDARRYFDTGDDSTVAVFRLPTASELEECPTYNQWEWGLTTPGGPLFTPYKDHAIEQAGGITAVVERYPKRNIVYLAGALDMIPNGECEARMQGPYRRQRSDHFLASLREICQRPVHHRLVVAGVHHDHCLMFQSPEGQQALFGLVSFPPSKVNIDTDAMDM